MMIGIHSGDLTEHGLLLFTGGFQGAEGFPANAEWWIEGVGEELDARSEFLHDEVTQELKYITNTTEPELPLHTRFEATRHRCLFNISGSPAAPVRGIALRGLVLRDTKESFLEDHGTPSGGDWALPYVAAVTLDGAESCEIADCLFTRLDGIAVELLGYSRGVEILRNDFEYLGASAIVLWGRTSTELDEEDGGKVLPSAFHPQGPDGRALDVPLDTLIEENEGHDLGLWQKQSSLLFQAVAARTTMRKNVAYNLPRAAINLSTSEALHPTSLFYMSMFVCPVCSHTFTSPRVLRTDPS